MREILLDARLGALADLVGDARVVADIGADHGRLACVLLQSDARRRMIVADVSADSLDKARRLLAEQGLTERAVFCVADGLAALDEPVDAIVLAGMGTKTIRQILIDGAERIGNAQLILQPNLDAPKLRQFLAENGFSIMKERIAQVDRRYYVIIVAERGEMPPLTDRQCALGVVLPSERAPEYLHYLAWRAEVLTSVLRGLGQKEGDRAERKRADIRRELAWIEEERA